MLGCKKEIEIKKSTTKVKKDTTVLKQKPTLVYQYGDSIEYNPHPKIHQIQEIKFKFLPCFGNCPYFDLTIHADKTAYFNAKEDNYDRLPDPTKKMIGKFKTVINDPEFENLTGLINYLDFENLKKTYAVPATDLPRVHISITYDNGRKKEIEDYGLCGTRGLSRLYRMAEDLRFNQKWVNATPGSGHIQYTEHRKPN